MRHAELNIVYNKYNISNDLKPHIIDFSYVDDVDAVANISLTLEDREKMFVDGWFPEDGDTVYVEILAYDWEYEGQELKLVCGTFTVDEIECDETMQIRATAIDIRNNARGQEKSRAWEKMRLRNIAEDIATSAMLKLFYDADTDTYYERKDQEAESDLYFLNELCRADGLYLKVSDSQLIIFDEKKHEATKSVITLEKGQSNIIGQPHFLKAVRDIYKACEVMFKNPDTGEKYISYFEDPTIKTGQVLKLNEDFNNTMSLTEINNSARKRLREKNKKQITAEFVLLGNTNLAAGLCVNVKGWYRFDGKYFIESATHSVGASGFTTSLQMRRCLEGGY